MSDQATFGERYRLVWRRPGARRVGEIRNYTVNEKRYRVVPILLDDALMNRISMRFLVSHWNSLGPEILVSCAFMDLPLQFREAGVWHEMGHIHHEHLLRDDIRDQAQLRAARLLAVQNGFVIPYEGEADRFAVAHVSRHTLIGFLEYLLETRPSGGRLGWNDIGRRELLMRIAAIRTF